jgi:hypothetical protein
MLERNQTNFVAINLRCGWDGGKSLLRARCGRAETFRAGPRIVDMLPVLAEIVIA